MKSMAPQQYDIMPTVYAVGGAYVGAMCLFKFLVEVLVKKT